MISPRMTFVLGVGMFVVVGIGIAFALIETQETALEVAFFGWIIGGSYLLSRIRCPNCGISVAYQGKLGGISIYAGFVRTRCQNCGEDLTKRA